MSCLESLYDERSGFPTAREHPTVTGQASGQRPASSQWIRNSAGLRSLDVERECILMKNEK